MDFLRIAKAQRRNARFIGNLQLRVSAEAFFNAELS
jgi:hypothetical protein